MRVFVSEYVCGGVWPEEKLDGSLAVEGRAMLLSLVQDLLRVPGVDLVATWDARLGTFPAEVSGRLSIVEASSPAHEEVEFDRLCEECEAAFVIAPDFHGILAARVAMAASRTKMIGSSHESTSLCSDKLQLAEFLNEEDISTIPTALFELSGFSSRDVASTSEFPCVIKPRDGAGSVLTFRVEDAVELSELSRRLQRDDAGFSFIRQPLVDGLAVSCAAIIAPGQGQGGDIEKPQVDVLPPCEQILSGDGRFSYEGADFPGRLKPADVDRIESVVRRCCSVIPGLCGYVGFDLVIPDEFGAEPLIVDINPRLTTGYLLWRKMCVDNLAARMLKSCVAEAGTSAGPLSWNSEPHTIRIHSLTE
jgi:predicted ATP-grasp superfamily ATP-dependent carboligase